MEEVDGIIAHSLRSVGCDLEDGVESLSQFSTELIVEATARCLKAINNDLDLPYKLPPSMSARFRVGTALATAVQELGYRGEVGYQTFLYSNESDIRRVLMFLIEKLPKEAAGEVAQEALGSSALLQRNISAELSRRLTLPWTPPHCKHKGICWRGTPAKWHREGCKNVRPYHATHLSLPSGNAESAKSMSKSYRKFYNSENLQYVDVQPRRKSDVVASLLSANSAAYTAEQEWETEWKTLGLSSRLTPQEYKAKKRERMLKRVGENLKQGFEKTSDGSSGQDLNQVIASMSDRSTNGAAIKSKGSRFTHIEKLQFAQDEEKTASQIALGEAPHADSEEEQQRRREEEAEELRTELSALNSQLDSLEAKSRALITGTQEMDDNLKDTIGANLGKEEEFKVKKRTIDLLPDARDNLPKLQTLIDGAPERMAVLTAQWENHRKPLEEQQNELLKLNASREAENEQKLAEMQQLRDRMTELSAETRNKDTLIKQLMSEYERMSKDVNRSSYTRRILEIVTNIKKQKQGIDKVLIDTRNLQKDINRLSGKLDRTFTVTDEMIFKDAKKDESVRKAYKYLAGLHENCGALIKTVEETGLILREIREFEDQINQEMKENTTDNLEKIMADFTSMKKENAALIAKYRKSQHREGS